MISLHIHIIVRGLPLADARLNKILICQDGHVHRCSLVHQLDDAQVLLLEGADQVETVLAVITELDCLSFLVDLRSDLILGN